MARLISRSVFLSAVPRLFRIVTDELRRAPRAPRSTGRLRSSPAARGEGYRDTETIVLLLHVENAVSGGGVEPVMAIFVTPSRAGALPALSFPTRLLTLSGEVPHKLVSLEVDALSTGAPHTTSPGKVPGFPASAALLGAHRPAGPQVHS
ncbi:hypothetical protein J6590_102062 [Homalodisca vitripennis]|nr:hypothetical protein J6590_023352 [Homalodisca vitripennis]KAG8299397.1 hypothetical protein J6590_102062 [Homalodisca vitripennis]